MKTLKTSIRIFILALISSTMMVNLTSCDKVEEVIPTIHEAVSFLNAELIEETLPEPKGNENKQPVIKNITGNGSVIAGGTNLLTIHFEDPNDDVTHVLLAMEGEHGYYRINVPGNSSSIDLTMLLDQDLIDNAISILVHLLDEKNNVSEPHKIPMTRVAAGTGNLQVSLAWQVDNDVDLHLVQPDGEEIYYGNTQSSTGGLLDIDSNAACDIDGVRNENITFGDGAVVLAGDYIVRVDFYEECQPDGDATPYTVIAYLEGQLVAATSGSNHAEGSFATGTADGGSGGAGKEVMRFNVPEQIGKTDVIVIDYGFTARQIQARTNPKVK